MEPQPKLPSSDIAPPFLDSATPWPLLLPPLLNYENKDEDMVDLDEKDDASKGSQHYQLAITMLDITISWMETTTITRSLNIGNGEDANHGDTQRGERVSIRRHKCLSC
jgi:hypothetical protein